MIKTNEGPPDKNVRIKATIVARQDSTFPIVIQPAKIEFAASDSGATFEFTIINKGTGPLVPTIVSAPRNLASITLPALIPAFKSAKGTVSLKKAGLKASFEKSVTIQLDDQAKSRFTIPIKRAGIGQAVVVPTGGH